MAVHFVALSLSSISRTLLQFGTCRDLGAAGEWLEADYSVRCRSDENPKYAPYAAMAWVAGAGYGVGLPVLFMYLVHKYKRFGKEGDSLIRHAIGGMYEPFKEGKEWWLGAEMIRILLLTSTIGLFGATCYFKILAAQLISLVFLVVFLIERPYRKRIHHLMQCMVMLVPVLAMGCT